MNDPLADQLAAQELPFDPDTVDHFQRDSEAISRLRVRGVITHSEGDRAYDRLGKRVWAEVARAAKANPPPSARPGQSGSPQTLDEPNPKPPTNLEGEDQ